ncbi:MAG TPA: ribosome-associated translation inhibitor RaiA [Gammaproteobacteria bacterium]|nr:ribosome-associated translation inhibitor RaiA [Gammaproteobacteria bacterium]
MTIQITALHDLALTPGLTQHVNDKFKKLEIHFSHIINTHVTLSIDKKFQQIAKCNMSLAGGSKIAASYTSNDMYSSIDMLVKELDKQIIKHKEKLKSKDKGSHSDGG